ncbi:MAG: MliC family protein [Candidatus Paceibacterota bacterium]
MRTFRDIALVIILLVLVTAVYGYGMSRRTASVIMPLPDAPDTIKLPVGKVGKVGDLLITFNSLTQDSRCPLGVMCIQAGAVTANVTLSSGGETETRNLAQDEVRYLFGGYAIGIAGAEPARKQGEEIAPGEYIVTFTIVPAIEASYACAGGRSIRAIYYGEDEVHLSLDDTLENDRQFYLPKAVSPSGAKYSNGDDSLVFWSEGKGAFVTEGLEHDVTFADCVETI